MILYLSIYIAIYLLYWVVNVVAGKGQFVWYDFWIGLYVDAKNHRTYFAGLPCLIIVDEWENLGE